MEPRSNRRVQEPGARRQRRFEAASGEKLDIVYLDPAATQIDLQEVITTLRQVADVNRIFNYSARTAIFFQAPPERALLAEWLISTLEKPGTTSLQDQSAAADEYRIQGPREDITRVFRWNGALTPAEVQQLVHNIRTEVEVTKMFTYARTRALVVRGAAAQLELASRLVAASLPAR